MRILTGSVQSSITAKQLPDIRYETLILFPLIRGSGSGIYLGYDVTVTVPSGGGDSITDGFYLDEYLHLRLEKPGNMNELWLIGTDASDVLSYIVEQ